MIILSQEPSFFSKMEITIQLHLSVILIDATIKNQKGETIKSFFKDIVLKGEGYGTYKCDPGTYYVVALVKNRSFGQLWKAQKIQVEKNKITRIDAVFGNMSAEGYVEWNN